MTPCPDGMASYTIQAGDTLWLISRRYNTTVDAIMYANRGLMPGNLRVGQTICIPRGRRPQPPAPQPPQPQPPSNCPVGLRAYTIQPGDSLWKLSQTYCTTVETIMAINPGINPNNLVDGQVIWIPAGYRFRNFPSWPRMQEGYYDEMMEGNQLPGCPEGHHSYVIQAGDTFWLLSQRFNTTVEALMTANPGINPNTLFVGQVICVPAGRGNTCPQPMPQPMPQPTPQPMPRPTPQPMPRPMPQPMPQPAPQPMPQPMPQPTPRPMPQPMPQPTPQPAPTPAPQPTPQPQPPMVMWVSKAEQNLNNYLRLLWIQNAYWLKMAIQSMIFDLPDTGIANARLMQSPKDFQTALQTLYGDDDAAAFAELLTNHLTMANELVSALMNSDANAAADAERRWYANADQMASFLSGINSNWSQESWQNMLRDYLDMIKNAINEMLAGNFDDAVTTFTDIESQSMEMADIMTDGIVKQFPQYFR